MIVIACRIGLKRDDFLGDKSADLLLKTGQFRVD